MERPGGRPNYRTGPEGQPIEVFYGKDSEGNLIEYEYYISEVDTIKHGRYDVYYEAGPKRFLVNFREGRRDEIKTSFPLQEGCDTGRCHEVAGKHDVDYWRNDKCVGTAPAICEGDEYDGY